MKRIVFLGTGSAISNHEHENSHLVIQIDQRVILVDCVGNPIVRLRQAGIDPLQVGEVVVTHFHPDHVSALPLFLMDLWLMGRKKPLIIYGLTSTVEKIQKMMALYDWDRWPEFFDVVFKEIPEEENYLVFDEDDLRMITTPVKHLIPTIGLRVEIKENKKVFVYSSDTEYCPQMIALAQNADVLVHEATGESVGHTSSEQCGQIAHEANVRHLYLTHYPPESNFSKLEEKAKSHFQGSVTAAQDLMEIRLD